MDIYEQTTEIEICLYPPTKEIGEKLISELKATKARYHKESFDIDFDPDTTPSYDEKDNYWYVPVTVSFSKDFDFDECYDPDTKEYVTDPAVLKECIEREILPIVEEATIQCVHNIDKETMISEFSICEPIIDINIFDRTFADEDSWRERDYDD